jgi:hypothetical protein
MLCSKKSLDSRFRANDIKVYSLPGYIRPIYINKPPAIFRFQ